MKSILAFILIFFTTAFSKAETKKFFGDPIVIEAVTNKSSLDDALTLAKDILLKQKFIAAPGTQKNNFTATRTTGSKADYYVADVTASQDGEKVKVKISFVKVGTGLLGLKKIANSVKEELEK